MRDKDILAQLASSMNYRNDDGTYNKLRETDTSAVEEEVGRLIAQQENRELKIPTDINSLLDEAWAANASDVHLSCGAPPKYRIHGTLKPIPGYSIMKPSDLKALLSPILSEEQKQQFDADGDLDFAYSVYGLGRFRCNFYKQRGTWSAVFRLLSDTIPDPKDLGIPDVVMNLVNRKRGLVLVTGPTGSGKSTTLAAMINAINKTSARNIITLEDPIEYTHKHGMCNINQREIGSDSKSFASALRAALRQDPDVIMVGEMRDFETISTAVTAAETGHLVFSTLHTLGAADTINRIIDTYPENQQAQARAQLAGSLEGIISQQLIPTRTGSGRVAAFEILLGNTAVRANIREGHIEQIPSSMQSARRDGMILLDQSLRNLVAANIITEDMALKFAVNPKSFADLASAYTATSNPFGRR